MKNMMEPFEMCEIKYHVKLIFVARQWIRHRTANVIDVKKTRTSKRACKNEFDT